jgi:3-oxoacyl-(acyl-carrier-protein) synthase III
MKVGLAGLPKHTTGTRRSTELRSVVDHSAVVAAVDVAIKGKSWLKCRPIGVGAFAGQVTMPNNDFASLVDTNDEWIGKRTGIRKRRLIKEGSSLRELAKEAGRDALLNAGITAADIDLVIVATSSPDDLFGDAAAVAHSIGATAAAAFDLTAACSGFLYGLVTGSQFIETGAYKKVLVIGADALSRFLDWEDRGTCILFGDGAGAMVLEAVENKEDSGLLGFALRSDGGGSCTLQVPFQHNFQALKNDAKTVVDRGTYGKMSMNGPEVYKFAVSEVRERASQHRRRVVVFSICCFDPVRVGAPGGSGGAAECGSQDHPRGLVAAAPGEHTHHGARQQGVGHPHGQGAAQHRRVWQYLSR